MVHAPFALTPTPLPMSCWRQACELAPLFNELVDRVSLDAHFLQNSLSRLLPYQYVISKYVACMKHVPLPSPSLDTFTNGVSQAYGYRI